MSENPIGPSPVDRGEVEALLAARSELGPSMEPALVDSFAEKIMAEVQRQSQQQNVERARSGGKLGSDGQLTLAIVSIVMAIPLTAIALGVGNFWMALVVWIGIVFVNFTYSMGRNKQP